MGGITKRIGKELDRVPAFIDPLAGNLWDVVELAVTIDERVLEEVLGLFGIEDEAIINSEVVSQRIIPDDISGTWLSQVALDHQKQPDTGVIEHLAVATNMIRGKYNSFYAYGEDTYYAGLPDTNIRSHQVDYAIMESTIEDYLNVPSITLISTSRGVPRKEEWVGWYLPQILGLNYYPWNETIVDPTFTYPVEAYSVEAINYSTLNDTYDVVFSLAEEVHRTVTERTTITVVVISVTEDEVTTQVDTVTEDIKSITGTTVSVVPVSTNVTTVPTGAVTEGVTGVIQSTSMFSITIDNDTIVIPSHNPVIYYIGKYYISDSAEYYYYMYDISSETNPALSDTDVVVSKLEMMPIIELRNNGISVTANKASIQYMQTKEILDTIGVEVDQLVESIEQSPDIANVMDAFVHFAVSPKDSSEIVSKVLYTMFSFIYNDAELYTEGLGTYSATLSEGAYNDVLLWSGQTSSVVTGSIGSVGTYNHTIVGDTLIMRRQDIETQYVEYAFYGLSIITFIDRAGADDIGTVSSRMYQDTFLIPISRFHITSFSPIEQNQLFAKSLQLSIYSAQVQYIDWYKTSSFGSLLQIVAIIVAVVIIILSWGTASAAGTSFYAWAMSTITSVATGLAVSYALTKVFESTDNEVARILATVAAIYITTQTGDSSSLFNVGVITANMLTQAVNIDVRIKQDRLREEQSVFGLLADIRQEELDTAAELATGTGVGVSYVAGLALLEPNVGYLEGIDSFMYRAKGQIQYQYGLLYDFDRRVGDVYSNAYRLDLNRSLS